MTNDNAVDLNRRLALLLGPAGPELSCEQCFEQPDRYVDLTLVAAKADQHAPGMRAHLEACPACHEHHESLMAFIARHRAAGN
jgi:hypothetical protein